MIKVDKRIICIASLLFLLFIGVSIYTFSRSSQLIEEGYLASEGNAAKDFAVLTASNIHLSDAQVDALKNYSYQELQDSEENRTLYDMMNNDGFNEKVSYAYVMVHLEASEVTNQIDDATKDFYDAPVGTPLDILWLLDVSLDSDDTLDATAPVEMNDVTARYSYYISEDDQIFDSKPTYILNSSEWGDHICGYAPLYSTEGTYIGAVGVELHTADYNSYRNKAMMAMGLLIIVSTLTLSLLFLYIYFKYRKLQYERIYTDSLTRIYNRSYYNNQFIKQMNRAHVPSSSFALLIADIDFFKKVNDTFGHEIGDQVLLEVSTILVEVFGRSHVVRFGGEEFVAGLWVKDIDLLTVRLQKLFDRMAETKFSLQQIDISLSLGCCYYQANDLTGWMLSGMLKAADGKLYEVKENGRKQYRLIDYKDTLHYEEDHSTKRTSV